MAALSDISANTHERTADPDQEPAAVCSGKSLSNFPVTVLSNVSR